MTSNITVDFGFRIFDFGIIVCKSKFEQHEPGIKFEIRNPESEIFPMFDFGLTTISAA